ncbi:MAG: patatin-like phospholipase family protein [Geminicoccaceae bacterium]
MVEFRTPGGEEIADDGGPIGLALTGGGLKASLFHIGVLARLAELDLLRRIDVISGTSGGALIAALYHLRLKRALDADGDIDTDRLIRMVAALESDFLKVAAIDLRAKLFENPLANLKRTSPQRSSAARFADLLERHFFRPIWTGGPNEPIEMRDLLIHPRGDLDFNPIIENPRRYCKAPELIINAANLATGQGWRFDARCMGEPTTGPASRSLSAAPRLVRTPYHRLPEAFASLSLGQAVAASMAIPGLLEPLHFHRLYPEPGRKGKFLDLRLQDGRYADVLGTEALRARGCARLIIGDASGFDASHDRRRRIQLESLEARRPGSAVLIHMLSEIETPEIKPISKGGSGHVVKDRTDKEVTSYGIERRTQKLIAGMRTDLDAPSEIEALSVMADGYLIAKRAFQRHWQRGQAWAEGSPQQSDAWRFTAVIEALRQPSKQMVKHLSASRLSAFSAPRLAVGRMFELGLLAVVAMLTAAALLSFWSAIRPEADADGLWLLATIGFSMLTAWLVGRRQRAVSVTTAGHAQFGWIDRAQAIVMALPLALGARFRRRTSRTFLRAGRIRNIDIKPITIEKRRKVRLDQTEPAAQTERKAA